METIGIGFSTVDDEPDKLINVACLGDIEKILEISHILKDFSRDISSVNIRVTLFDIPEDSEFRYVVDYVICYINEKGRPSVYQYFQGKYDSRDMIESEPIDLDDLINFLIGTPFKEEERFVSAIIVENRPVVPEGSTFYDNYDDAFINLFAEAIEGMKNDKEFPQDFAKEVENIYLEGDLRKMKALMDIVPMANYYGKWVFSESRLETLERI